jgi:hypothetical protein
MVARDDSCAQVPAEYRMSAAPARSERECTGFAGLAATVFCQPVPQGVTCRRTRSHDSRALPHCSALAVFEEEVHPMRRPAAVSSAVAEHARAAHLVIQLIEQFVETTGVGAFALAATLRRDGKRTTAPLMAGTGEGA